MRNTCLYKVAGPKTFRLASTQVFKKWGANLQNIEKSVRVIYEPDGYNESLYNKCLYYLKTFDLSIFNQEELDTLKIFVQVDQSGAEALIVAYYCEAGQYRELFKNGIKPHSFLGMHLFKDIWPKKMRELNLISGDSDFNIEELIKCPINQLKLNSYWKTLDACIKDSDNWSLNERYYYLAKQTEHGSNYDIQAPKFRLNILDKSGGKIVIGKEDSERFLATKFSLFPEIKGYHRYVEQSARRDRVLFNCHGHPYQITSYEILDTALKEFYAWIPQSTVGEITNKAFSQFYQFSSNAKMAYDLLANTHDSYLIQCPVGQESSCATQAKSFMEQEFTSPIDGAVFSMRSEAQIGFNWSNFKAGKNELGLREIKLN